jgi:lipopolysaccharide export system protein LptC
MSVLNSQAGQAPLVLPLRPAAPASGWRPRRDDRHSRRVALLKRLLPVVGAALLALVAIWPRLVPFLDSVRFGLSIIDLREAHELRMLNPRYAGVDRFNRPYVVTSAVGRQAPDRDDLMSLERPRAEMTTHSGALVVLTAATAMYQTQAQLLDLFGDVNLVHENGTRFVTSSAHVDVAADTAAGNDPVTGHGPSGDITAQGFRVVDRGDTIVFTGKSNLLLKGTRPSVRPGANPPTLPAEVAETAAALEAAAAMAPATVGSQAPVTADPLAGTTPAATFAPAAKPRGMAKPEGKLPGEKTPAVRAKGDAG